MEAIMNVLWHRMGLRTLMFTLWLVLAIPAWANSPPVAVDDQAYTHTGQPVAVRVTANDSDPDGDTVVVVDNPVVTVPPIDPADHGAWRKLDANTVEYTPAAGYTGNDSFQYEIGDGNGARRRAYVHVSVGNRPPVAVDDQASTHAGQAITINVTANDSDPDGDTVVLVDNPVVTVPPIDPADHGTWRKLNATTIEYTPTAGYSGSDSFQYEIGDGYGGRHRAFVQVTIGNQPPIAVDDHTSTHAGLAVALNVTANDSDPDGDSIIIVDNPVASPPIDLPDHGSWRKLSGSSLEYTPAAGYTGSDAFQYEIGDGNGARRRAYVYVAVGNQAPQAVADQAGVAMNSSVLINVVANDIDPDGDALSLITQPVVIAPAHGQALKVSGTSIQYTPTANYVGTDQFTYEVGDGNGGRSRAVVSVTVRSESFTLAMTPASHTVTAGQTTSFSVSATGSGGFSGSIALNAASLPNGVTAQFVPAAIGPGQSAQMNLSVANNATPSMSTLRVSGASGGLTATASASLQIVAPAGQPVIASLTPEILQRELVDVTLLGSNLAGARVEVGDEIAPGMTNGRTYPTVSIVSAPAGGTQLNLRIDARDTRIEGWYSLYVRTPSGVAGALFRVVGPAPVLDYASPGDVVPGQRFAFMMIGANLNGASITASTPDIEILDIENSNAEALMGYLSVRAGAPVGEFNLNIARNGHVARVGVRIRENIEKVAKGPTLVQRASDGAVLYSVMPLVDLKPGASAGGKQVVEPRFDARSFTICIGGRVERTRGFRHVRTWFKNPLTGQWGPFGQAILDQLSPALRQIVQTQTAAFWVTFTISASIQLCYNSDIDGFYYDGEVCASFEIGFQIPIVGGVVVSGSFCYGPGGFEDEFDITGTGLLRRLQFHRRSGGQVEELQCTNVTELDPLSLSGERTYEFQTGPCCQEEVGFSWDGEFEIGTFSASDVPMGRVDTGAPGTCPAAIPKIRVAAFIPFDYVISVNPFDQCQLPFLGPAGPVYKGDERGFEGNVPATRSRLTQVLDLDAGLIQDWNPGATLNYALDAVSDGVLDDRDYDGVARDCRLWHATDRTIDNPDHGENFVSNAGTFGRLFKYQFRQAGNNPISTGSPDIDWDITVTLDLRNASAPTYSIQGMHDCFPAYEIAIDNKVVYGFMPADGDSGTVARCLPAPMDVQVRCSNVPLGQACNVPKK
jgi:hypothetical protein